MVRLKWLLILGCIGGCPQTPQVFRWLEAMTPMPGFVARSVWAKGEIGHHALNLSSLRKQKDLKILATEKLGIPPMPLL